MVWSGRLGEGQFIKMIGREATEHTFNLQFRKWESKDKFIDSKKFWGEDYLLPPKNQVWACKAINA
jgi:hypothetical protein